MQTQDTHQRRLRASRDIAGSAIRQTKTQTRRQSPANAQSKFPGAPVVQQGLQIHKGDFTML
jgi:hypothetical protein